MSFRDQDLCVNLSLALRGFSGICCFSLWACSHTELFELSILLSSVDLLAAEPKWYLNTINGKRCWDSPFAQLRLGIIWQLTTWFWQTDSLSIIKTLIRLNTASCLQCSEHKAANSLFFACPWLVTSCNCDLVQLSYCIKGVYVQCCSWPWLSWGLD